MASNLHLIDCQVTNHLQTQTHIWNSNPGLRTRSLMFPLSISRYRKNPRVPDITIWGFRGKVARNKMKKFMRKYNISKTDFVNFQLRLSILFNMISLIIYSFCRYNLMEIRRLVDFTINTILLPYCMLTSKFGKNVSATLGWTSCATVLSSLHFDVICDQRRNRRTGTSKYYFGSRHTSCSSSLKEAISKFAMKLIHLNCLPHSFKINFLNLSYILLVSV